MQQFYFILNTVSWHCKPHLVFNGNSIAEITVAMRGRGKGGTRVRQLSERVQQLQLLGTLLDFEHRKEF